MGERHQSDTERADAELRIDIDNLQLDLFLQPFLGELVRDQAGGEAIGVERYAEVGGEIGNRADMILVPMGQDDTEQVVLAILDKFEVGHHDVDPWIILRPEADAEIEHDPLAVAAIEIGVHADLSRAAEREEKQFLAGNGHAEMPL